MSRCLILLAACLSISVATLAQPAAERPLMIEYVSLSPSQIAFTYAGKIWLVDRTGGAAKRLTNKPNDETSPVFLPDGRRIAVSRMKGHHWGEFLRPAVTATTGTCSSLRLTAPASPPASR